MHISYIQIHNVRLFVYNTYVCLHSCWLVLRYNHNDSEFDKILELIHNWQNKVGAANLLDIFPALRFIPKWKPLAELKQAKQEIVEVYGYVKLKLPITCGLNTHILHCVDGYKVLCNYTIYCGYSDTCMT